MQLICGEDVSSAAVDEWTGRMMQQHTLNMAIGAGAVQTSKRVYKVVIGL